MLWVVGLPAIIRNSLFLPIRQACHNDRTPAIVALGDWPERGKVSRIRQSPGASRPARADSLTEDEAMRFWLLDKIRSYKPEVELSAVKNVTMTEEYLADHFPEFPVLPGVFMLEAATQAAAWLLRLSENFAHSIISLKEARNIKYADFVAARPNAGCHRLDAQEGRPAGHVQSRRPDRRSPNPQRPDRPRNVQPGRSRSGKLAIDEKLETKFRKTLRSLLPANVAATAS